MINKFIVFSKRILHRKMYLIMLLFIIALGLIYRLLPAKSQSAEIKVGIVCDDTSAYANEIFDRLYNSRSVYTFYQSESIDALINEIKSGNAECGYYIPNNFVNSYIAGQYEEHQILQYVSPSTTLATPINETLFAHIFKVCAYDIMCLGANMHEYDSQFKEALTYYIDSDEVFQLQDLSSNKFSLSSTMYHINIPILEICLILTFFSALIGLLSFLTEYEKGFYYALPNIEQFAIKNVSIMVYVLPVMFASLISVFIIGASIKNILLVLLFSVTSHITSLLISIIIRKSTLLIKVLPFFIFVLSVVVFVQQLL